MDSLGSFAEPNREISNVSKDIDIIIDNNMYEMLWVKHLQKYLEHSKCAHLLSCAMINVI